MLLKIKKYLSLIKFSHTVFAFPFAIIGYLMGVAEVGNADLLEKLILVSLCMVFARNAAMAFNRYIDRHIDKQNNRTKNREIPAGIIKPQNALFFIIINAILFIGSTYFINMLCFYLSPIALLVVLGYSYTKRFTALCHFVLGLGLSLAPVGAYIAVTSYFSVAPIILSLSVLLWVSGFDIIYALQDYEFDKNNKLKSVPVLLGKNQALFLSRFLHLVSVLLIFSLPLFYQTGLYYLIGASVFAVAMVLQHSKVKIADLSKINLVFFTTNGLASLLYAGFFLADFLFFSCVK